MRHNNHRFALGVKKEHREALVAGLAAHLFTHGRIRTTLVKAKALRPFAESIITLAKKAAKTEDTAVKLHFRRLAIARVRNKVAVKKLFDEGVEQFLERSGGYTRIYKLQPRVGDAAPMGLIEYVSNSTEKRRRSPSKPAAPVAIEAKAEEPAEAVKPVEVSEAVPTDLSESAPETTENIETSK